MDNSELTQRRRFVGISILMLVMGVLFLFYLGNSLCRVEKRLRDQAISSALHCP